MTTPATIIEPSPRDALIVTLFYSVFVVLAPLFPDSLIPLLGEEEGFTEHASALAYLVGFILTVALARRTAGWLRAHWVMWAVLCVMFFGEETSWLQHWLGYATPEAVKEINAQGEFNLHNLQIISKDDTVLGPGGPHFDLGYLASAQHLFNLGFGTYFLVLPLLMRLEAVRNTAVRFGFPVLAPRFLLMTWIPIAVSVVLTYAYRDDFIRRGLIGETREMFFALTICAFLALAYRLNAESSGRKR